MCGTILKEIKHSEYLKKKVQSSKIVKQHTS